MNNKHDYDSLYRLLGEKRMERIKIYGSLDSTNRITKEAAKDGAPAGTVFIADSQSRGRGRLGRSFSSPAGTGIYLSAICRPVCEARFLTRITPWCAVAVRRAILSVCGVSADIKWVNDLLLHGKKFCGILTETGSGPDGRFFAVIGIGINVNTDEAVFPPELREKAGSLRSVTGKEYPRDKLAARIICELDEMMSTPPDGPDPYIEEYRCACISTGMRVKAATETGERAGYSGCILDDYSIEVRFDDGVTEAVMCGEVSLRTENGYI